MKTTIRFATLALMATLHAAPALAGPGHDHDHAEAAPAAAGPALPRFAASSELFELVGVLDGRRLTLYLDRAADNSPVVGAGLEIEIAGQALRAVARDDVYEVDLPAAPPAGVLPVTATVMAGPDSDLLAADFDIPAPAAPPPAATLAATLAARGPVLAGTAGALALLAALGLVARRRAVARRAGTGAAA